VRRIRDVDLTITLTALERFLAHAWTPSVLEALVPPEDGSWGLLAADDSHGNRHLVAKDDSVESSFVALLATDGRYFDGVPVGAYRSVLERMHRFALEAQSPPLRLPPGWNAYHADNRVAFFATRRDWGSWRWVAELGAAPLVVCFWQITSTEEPVDLDTFTPTRERLARLLSERDQALSGTIERLAGITPAAATASLQATVDLEEAGFGAVVGHLTESQWRPKLTSQQAEFVDADSSAAIKLRGPAGSGKTLALELKLLREAHASQNSGRPLRALFTTHSWAMAEQVDSALSRLNEGADLSLVDVYPLISIAQTYLPSERGGLGFELLGEDSLSGKQLQIEHLNAILDRFLEGDWLTFERRVSAEVARRVVAPRDTPERNAFVWDLLIEFGSVLSAQGILPGVNAERRYLEIQRAPWMMPLPDRGDRLLVLRIYSDYVDSLREERFLTSDQLINDFLNYLETFTWNIRREDDGYDLIFVDELHLFTEQERLVLHYLTRRPDEYPRMFMALDPRQSPAEIYMSVDPKSITRTDTGLADALLGSVRSVELSTVHRFTPAILDLIRHINQMYPALDLGEDWELDLTEVSSSRTGGDRPSLVEHSDRGTEVQAVLARAAELATDGSPSARVAVIAVDPLQLEAYIAAVGTEVGEGSVTVIRSRDDVDRLRYSRRTVVLGAAEFLGGLQFSHVLVVGLPSRQASTANQGHSLRRLLSLLYLAVSRATDHVEIHVNDEAGGIPEILESAVSADLLELARTPNSGA
jgi:hypothetical protein